MAIKDFKISTKLICGLLSLVLLFMISSSYQMYSLRRLRIIQQDCAQQASNVLAIQQIGFTVERSGSILDTAGAAAEPKKEFSGLRQTAARDMETIGAIAATAEEKQLAAGFAAQYAAYLDAYEKLLGGGAGQKDLLAQERAGCLKPLAGLQESLVKKSAEGNSTYQGIALMCLNIAGYTTLLVMLLCLLIGYFILRPIRIPIVRAVRMADDISMGDLEATIDVQQKDEIGLLAEAMRRMVGNLKGLVRLAEKISRGDLAVRVKPLSDRDLLGHALKTMVEKLSGTIADINLSADSVAAGAAQMSSASQAMSSGATRQASSLEEISSSMNEIAAQTIQNAENASLANRFAGETMALAEQGNEQMTRMVSAMHEINESSGNISKIIKVIDEIAFQTNLLALNAAVEAARAGRHGKGFSVVAQEVRNLAARSARAARETAEMIEGSVRRLEDGTGMADKTAHALSQIVASAAKVTDLVAGIARASNEQAQGISQITAGLEQIDHVTQQNTAHAEESAAAAQELTRQSMVLQQLVAAFKIDRNIAAVGQEQRGLESLPA
jgi:methyl-accepting chemotaxis protein